MSETNWAKVKVNATSPIAVLLWCCRWSCDNASVSRLGLTQCLLQAQWQQIIHLVRITLRVKFKLLSKTVN